LQSAIDNLNSTIHRGHSSVGRAPALQAGSQGFESPCLHFNFRLQIADFRFTETRAKARDQINRQSSIENLKS
jgi:hypothetical protein